MKLCRVPLLSILSMGVLMMCGIGLKTTPAAAGDSETDNSKTKVVASLLPAESKVEPAAAGELLVYISSPALGKSHGVSIYRLNTASGAVRQIGVRDSSVGLSFLAVDPSRRFLYGVGQGKAANGKNIGQVAAFAIDAKSGLLKSLNQQSSRGAGPCHLSVDRTGHNVLVANYTGGNVAVLPIQNDGSLRPASGFVQHHGSSVNPGRQRGPHAHAITLDPAGRFACAVDLGLDQVLVYRLDSKKGTLTPNKPPFASVAPGAGPRHVAFRPDGRFAYVVNEMNSTVTAFSWNAEQGVLKNLQTVSSLPKKFHDDNTMAEVFVHPSGRFLYGSNRGHDSIVIFAIDKKTGRLTLVGHESTQGKVPRNFAIGPNGRFLLAANQSSGTVVVFRIDPKTGKLKPTGHVIHVPTPLCVVMIPAGQ